MGSRPEQNRIVWITIVAVIVVLAVGGAIGSKSSSSSSTINRGTRAVVVPTADAARTVLVPPCGTGASVTSANASTVANIPGTASVQLPQGGGLRVVLIPKCSAGQGGTAGTSYLPSALFVPRPGSPLPSIGTARNSSSSEVAAPESAQFELTVPNGSPIRTIVVSPCAKPQGSKPAEQILAAAGRSSTAIAPPC
jgi:hypothetical protein